MGFFVPAGVVMTMAADIPTRDGGYLLGPIDFNYNNEQVMLGVDAANDRPAGLVLGKLSVGTATSAAKAGGNTGNGTLTMDATTPILANATTGIYTLRVVQVPGANQALLELRGPTGLSLGTAAYNGAGQTVNFNNRLKFAVVDGATDFVIGDGFDITVAVGSGQYVPYNPAGRDGSQVFAGILYGRRPKSAAAQRSVVTVRDVTVNGNALAYGNALDAGQLATLYAQMAEQKVIVRL